MRKFTLLVSMFLVALSLSAQTNLVQNPGFETWATLPDPWYIVSTTVTGVTPAPNTTLFTEGTKSIKIDATGASGAYNMAQSVTIIPGHNYTLTAKYYIESGDGTDARIWCNYKKDATTYFSEAELVATGDYAKLRSGNTSSSGTAYLPDVKGSWQTYTVDFTAPSTAVGFDFQFRTYKTAIVNWDNMILSDLTAGVTSPKQNLKLFAANGKINFEAAEGETVEVYNTVGQKVLSAAAISGNNSLAVNAKGVVFVKVGNRTGKVIL